MLRINNIKLGISDGQESLYKKAEKLLGCPVRNLKIVKKSIDARRKNDIKYVYSVDVCVSDEAGVLRRSAGSDIQPVTEYGYNYGARRGSGERPVVVGTGPAGLFAALILCENGYRPIVLERGKSVEQRSRDIDVFCRDRVLDENSNVQFGEGGAGTFSDGKLTTGIKDPRIKRVIDDFVRFGAPEEIAYLAKPHVGTDNLRRIVSRIRGEIIRLGGEVRFSSRMTGIETENGAVSGVTVSDSGGTYFLDARAVLLCIGHSARDTIQMLYGRGVEMLPKPFSIGARIEHPRELINKSCYGSAADILPATDYKLSVHLENGRGVYTFCMCPGGEVINSAGEIGGVVTNGMSNFARSAPNSNSALLVGVSPKDFEDGGVLGGIELQRRIERAAFTAAGGDYTMPAVTAGDFLAGRVSKRFGAVKPSVRTGTAFVDFDRILPDFVTDSMRTAIQRLERQLHGFSMPDAVLTAPETRSSSPVKILRSSETYETNIRGLFSAGEGGGHAGGITSSAVDGIKAAEKIGDFFSREG